MQLEALQRNASQRDDLRGEPIDDLCGNRVVGSLRKDNRSELDDAGLLYLLPMDRLRKLLGSRETEVPRDGLFQARLRPATVLAARGGNYSGEPDVIAASPVAGDRAE